MFTDNLAHSAGRSGLGRQRANEIPLQGCSTDAVLFLDARCNGLHDDAFAETRPFVAQFAAQVAAGDHGRDALFDPPMSELGVRRLGFDVRFVDAHAIEERE